MLTPRILKRICEIITGGSGGYSPPLGYGLYRSTTHLQQLFWEAGYKLQISGSRFPSVLMALEEINHSEDGQQTLERLLTYALSSSEYHDETARMRDLDVLGGCLREEGFRYVYEDHKIRLYRLDNIVIILDDLRLKTAIFDLDTVRLDLDRARSAANNDPEDAITAACSLLESLFRTIILASGEELPEKKDIGGLWKVVQKNLRLTPDRSDLPSEIADDVKKLLGSISNSVCHIGSLRTHAGDAHGRESGRKRVDARIARLAINSAQASALFCIETWERLFPGKPLKAAIPVPDVCAA
jgi:hypothetical protein